MVQKQDGFQKHLKTRKIVWLSDDFGSHLVFGPFENRTSSIIVSGFQAMI
jgi:hypothetical protein